MIRHICMFKLKEENKAALLTEAMEKAQTLRSIETMKHFEVVASSPLTPDSNYDFALICDFDGVQGLEEYQPDPIHIAFGQFIGTVRETRACIDYDF